MPDPQAGVLGVADPSLFASNPFIDAGAIYAYNIIHPTYGGKNDGQTVADGAIGSGSAILTSPSNKFASAKAGMLVTVDAGPASNQIPLAAKVLSVQSAGQMTLDTPAASTFAAATVYWGSDNLAAINAAAVVAGNAGGGRLTGPGGIYMVSSQPTLPSHVGIDGSGPAGFLIVQGFAHLNGVDTAGVLINSSTSTVGTSDHYLHGFQIRCLPVVGVSPGLTRSTMAINFQGASDVVITGCWFANGTVRGMPLSSVANTGTVHSTGNNNRWRFQNSRSVDGAQATFFLQGTDFICVGNEFSRSSYDSTCSINSSGERIIFSANLMDGKNLTYLALAHVELTSDGAGDANGIRDVTVTGNILLNHANATTEGVRVAAGTDITVTGNTIRNLLGNPIVVATGGGAAVSGRVTIASNNVNCPAGGLDAIKIFNDGATFDVAVTGNVISTVATGGGGIVVGGGGVTVTGIVITGNRVKSTVNNAIQIGANVNGGLCCDNVLYGSVGGYMQYPFGTGWIVKNNPPYTPRGGNVAAPAFPATTVVYTNNTGFDLVAYILNGTSAQTPQVDSAILPVVPASAFFNVIIPALSTFKPTYAAGAPTWVFYAL
jgi:hypothetical protein